MEKRNTPISTFDPNSFSNKNNTIFGLPHSGEEAYIHILPVPWEVTASYIAKTARAPEQIFEASFQVDLWDEDCPKAYERGYYFIPQDDNLYRLNQFMRQKAEYVIYRLFDGVLPEEDEMMRQYIGEVNQACQAMNGFVYKQTKDLLASGKKVIALGGDHSIPYGYMKALAEKYDSFSVLVIDAHLDMRPAFEHFHYSHASIMYNALIDFPQIKNMRIVGIRDYCEDEKNYALSQKEKVAVYYNRDIKNRLFEGGSWRDIVEEIISGLSDKVYVSVDIDGLQPSYCPSTGTPVIGGLDTDQLFYLLRRLFASGKNIIGADMCEVGYSENEWDANVGARVLYKLCNLMV